MLLFALACARNEPPPPPNPPAPTTEPANLLTVFNGSVAISRTYELQLESSIAHAMDGDLETYWGSPRWAKEMSGVFALPSRTRITSVGVTVPTTGGFIPRVLRFEGSLDGAQWTPLASLSPKRLAEPQLVSIKPFDASFVRVTSSDAENSKVVALRSLHVHGAALAPPRTGSLDGCWSINGFPAKFVQSGARVTGVIGDQFVEGGNDGHAYRLLWTKLPQYGMAAVAVTSDGQHLSGLRWHEEPLSRAAGDGWIGVRAPCATEDVTRPDFVRTFFERAGRYPLFGLRFDDRDQIDLRESDAALRELANIVAQSPSQRFVIKVHEFREATPAANRARAERRAASLRAVVPKGVTVIATEAFPIHRPVTDAMRAMYSTVDLQPR
ncbi:MAG TPA: hypothetical protein VMU84_12230 [Thermoanaerobaculia bacterium]|nr:hypothetical protein [Thermoanaerobaculia bacterium]